MGETVLIVGGARSGKTRLAERLAGEAVPVTYVATATYDASDGEMADRIGRHRADRPPGWSTREVPRDLEATLVELAGGGGSVVIDCLTLWLTNLMLGLGDGPELDDEAILTALGRAVGGSRGGARMIWVSNEVGMGVVPDNPLARRFVDLQGRANQAVAAGADAVHFCVSGLPIRLK